jgi:hypothetical protein
MSLQSSDNYITWFSKHIQKLRHYPNIELFDLLFLSLKKRKQYGKDQELWKELYKRSLHYYDNAKQIGRNNIPIKLVTKHNNILSFYMQQHLHNTSNAILRFDTHSDLNAIKNSSLLPSLYKKYINSGNLVYVDEAQKIVWDIGAAKSGVLFTTGIKDVIWCLPSWVPDQEITIDYYIKHGKRNLTLATTHNLKHIYNMDEWTQYRNNKGIETNIFSKVQMGKISKNKLKHIINIIKRNGKNYILDIDLDFFVCNGKKFTNNYFKDSYDLQSFYRTPEKHINQMYPRNSNYNNHMLQSYENHLTFELKQINKRIKRFIYIIAYLKRKGYTPSHISICDSTNILFEDCQNCNSISNGYVPQTFALLIHNRIIEQLGSIL